jgi:hypothetical protein
MCWSHGALIVALACLAGCDPGPPADSYELTGRIFALNEAGEEGEPIVGAVVIFQSDTLLVEETRSEGEGRYRMRVSTDHPFGQVRAEADGFFPNEETVYFDQPQRRVDIGLRRMF